MGIEALAVFPACVGIMALAIVIVFHLRNIPKMFQAVLFSAVLIFCSTTVLVSTVFLFEFLGIAVVGEFFFLGATGFVIYRGLRYGRMRLGFTTKELILQGIIAVCGCATTALCFLGWTVRI